MVIGKRYQDALDEGHIVVPVSTDGNCRHFHEGVYCGKAKVPPQLFADAGERAQYYGFVPEDRAVQSQDG